MAKEPMNPDYQRDLNFMKRDDISESDILDYMAERYNDRLKSLAESQEGPENDGFSDEDIRNVIQSYSDIGPEGKQALHEDRIRADNPDSGAGDFVGGVKAGSLEMANLVRNGGAAYLSSILGDISGDEDYKKASEDYAKKYLDTSLGISSRYPKQVEDLRSIDSIGDAADYAQRALGEGLPSIMASLFTGGVGGIAGGQIAKRAGVELAEQVIKSKVKGAAIGAVVGSAAQNIPESYVTLKIAGVDAPATATLVGAAKSGLDFYTPFKSLEKIFGPELSDPLKGYITKQLVTRTLGGVAEAAASEGVTEAAQQFLDEAATSFYDDNKELASKDTLWSVLEAGVMGAISGAPFGGASSYIQAKRMASPDGLIRFDTAEEAIDYLNDAGVDITQFADNDALRKAASQIANGQSSSSDYSPAIRTLLPSPENMSPLSEANVDGVRKVLSLSPDDFMDARQNELLNNFTFAQDPDNSKLIAGGLSPAQIVALSPNTRKEFLNRINSLGNTLNTNETLVVTPEGESGTQQQQDSLAKRRATEQGLQNQRIDQAGRGEASQNTIFMDANGQMAFRGDKANFDQAMDSADQQKRGQQIAAENDMANNMFFVKKDGTVVLKGDKTSFENQQRMEDQVKQRPETAPTGETEDQINFFKKLQEDRTRKLNRSPHPVPEAVRTSKPPLASKPSKGEPKSYEDIISQRNARDQEAQLQETINTPRSFGSPIEDMVRKDKAAKAAKTPSTAILPALNVAPVDDKRVQSQKRALAKAKKDLPTTRFQTASTPLMQTEQGDTVSTTTFVNNRLVHPQVIFNNLLASPSTFAFDENKQSIVDGLNRVLREVAGPNAELVASDAMESIDPKYNDKVTPLRGAQIRNMIFVALNYAQDTKRGIETALHESWHFLFNDTDAFSEKEKGLLKAERPRLRQFLNDRYGINIERDLPNFSDSEAGWDEAYATAFGLVEADRRMGSTEGHANIPVAKRLFNKALNILQRFGNLIRGHGFKTFEDMFNSVGKGEKNSASLLHENMIDEMRKMRFQVLGDGIRKIHIDKESDQEAIDSALDHDNMQSRLNGPTLSYFKAAGNRLFRSMAGMSHDNGVASVAYGAMKRREDDGNELSNRYKELMAPVWRRYGRNTKPVGEIMNFADMARKAVTKATINDQGYLQFTDKDGAIKTLTPADPKDPNQIALYKGMARSHLQVQQGFEQVLMDLEGLIRQDFTELGLNKDITTKELREMLNDSKEAENYFDLRIEEARDQLEAGGRKLDESTKTRIKTEIQNLKSQLAQQQAETKNRAIKIENLENIERIRKTDYAPHMRFGRFGMSVWRKEDLDENGAPKKTADPIYFGTMEDGKHNGVSKYQYDEHLKAIKDKGYMNNKDYVVFGADKPFLLTKSFVQGQLNDRQVTFELLSSLVYDKDESTYKEMSERLKSETRQKGYARFLSPARDVDGYSTDWTRSVPFYFSGMSHYLAKTKHRPYLNLVKTKINENLEDLNLKKDMNKYFDYIEGSDEDMMTLRQLNYLWTMGLNLSTGILQLVTLPTSTMMSMNTYRGNIFKNGAAISKYFTNSLPLIKELSVSGEKKSLDLSNIDTLTKHIRKIEAFKGRGYTKQQEIGLENQMLSIIRSAQRQGRIAGYSVDEYAKRGNYDLRTTKGRVQEGLNEVTNFLGTPVAVGEQLSRLATILSHADMFLTDPKAKETALRILEKDGQWKEIRRTSTRPVEEDLAFFAADEAHAVFGKVGRQSIQRGIGGAVLIPFMTQPQQVIEAMVRTWGRGPEGKKALAYMIASLFVLTGAVGLPGAELAKNFYEGIYKQITGVDLDLELEMRKRISAATGEEVAGEVATNGILRPLLGVSVAKRLGLGMAVPALTAISNVFGMSSDHLSAMGVPGSMMTQAMDGWEKYNQSAPPMEVAQALSPVALANIIKAYNYKANGVKTKSGNKLLTGDDVSVSDVIKRGLGFEPDRIATAREEEYYSNMETNKYTLLSKRVKAQIANIRTERLNALKDKDQEKAKELMFREKLARDEFFKYMKAEGQPVNKDAFNKAVKRIITRNKTGKKDPGDLRKSERKARERVKEILYGKDEDNKDDEDNN